MVFKKKLLCDYLIIMTFLYLALDIKNNADTCKTLIISTCPKSKIHLHHSMGAMGPQSKMGSMTHFENTEFC